MKYILYHKLELTLKAQIFKYRPITKENLIIAKEILNVTESTKILVNVQFSKGLLRPIQFN